MTPAYSEQGKPSTPPIILIHAFPLNRQMWKHQMSGLSHKIQVIAPDLPGFGESPLVEEASAISNYTNHIIDFLNSHNIPHAIFGGCSMGGYILFDLWRRYPERTAGLILCDTRAEEDTPEIREKRLKTITEIRSHGHSPLLVTILPILLCSHTRVNRTSLVDEVRQWIIANSSEGIIHALVALAARPDSTSILPFISVPTLIMVGQEDELTPPELARSLQNQIPNSRLEIIPSAGHLSPYEQPEIANAAILKFLQNANFI